MHIRSIHIILLLFAVMCFQVLGCGKKGPPVPPGYVETPAAADLQYRVDGEMLILSWTVPEGSGAPTNRPAGAKVLRLKKPLNHSTCSDCPPTFMLIKKMPVKPGNAQFQDIVEKGFGYYYKVVLYGNDGFDSDESNVVGYEFK